MKKFEFIFCSIILHNVQLFGQNENNIVLNSLLKNQKVYVNSLPVQDKKFYLSIINMGKWIRPKVISKITSLETNFKLNDSNLNIFEGYDLPHGTIYGLIWQDTTYYEYINNPTKIAGSDLSVAKKYFSELTDDDKAIVSNFNNWKNKIFKNLNSSPRNINPPLYYLATKVSNKKIKTIGFCY